MNFTKEDLQRIAKGLKQLSIKDTQFANAKALTTETKFPVVQSSVNVLLTAAQLLNFLVSNLDANSLTINIPNWTSGTLSNLIGRLYTLVTAPRDANGNPITAETIEYSNTIDDEITSVANALDYVIDQLLDKIDAIEIAGEPRLDPTQMPIITLNNIVPTGTCPITVGSGMWFDENHILQYRDGSAVPPVDVEIGPPVDMLYYYDGNAYKYNTSMQAFVKVGAVDLSSYVKEDDFTGRLGYDMMPWVVLKSMTIPNVQVLNTHKDFCYYNPYNRKVTFHKSDLTTSSYNPEEGIIYYDVSSGNFLIWNGGDANPWTVIGGTSSDSNKADLLTDTTMLAPTEWPKVVINNIDVYDDNDDQPGDVIYDYAHEKLVLFKGYDDNLEPVYVDMGRPQEGTVYCLKSTNALYRWENDTLQWIPITSGGGSADLSNYYTRGDVNSLLSTKVDKEPDKSLMMDAERIKLQGIAEGAEVNVQADWNQTTTTADDYIKNKPDLTQYQPILTAGENITIATNPQTGNLEISASGSGSPASNKADILVGTEMLTPSEWPKVVINNIGPYDDNGDEAGDVIYDFAHEKLMLFNGYDDDLEPVYIDMGRPQEGTVYCLKSTNTFYRWENDTLQWIPVGGGSADLSNYYNKNDVDSLLSRKVNTETGKVLIPSTDLTKLQNLPTADQLTQQLGQKANDSAVVKSISVNGTPQTKDGSGNVNIQVQTGSTIFPADTAPQMDGNTASVGSSAKYAREDHVHPHDSSKQDKLTFDNAPTAGSNNPVKSNGVKTYVDNKLTNVVINEIENLNGAIGLSNSGGTTYIMFGNSSLMETTVAPSISHSTPTSNGTTVTITNNDDDTNATIYYTTDGSTPTAESNVYSAPFIINSAATVKAIAYADNKMPSSVTSHTIEGSAQPTFSISSTSTRSTITATGASQSTLVYIKIDEGTWISGLRNSSVTIQKGATAQSVTAYAYAIETGKLQSAQVSQMYNIPAIVHTTLEGTCQNAAQFNVTIGSTRYPVTPTGDSAPYSWSVELENVTSLQCGDGSTNNIFGNNSDTNILSISAIPSSVTEIGIRAFANMSALTSFTTGGCAAVIKSRAFINDNAVTDLTITDACDIDSGADSVFTGCPPIRLYLGAGITKIPDNAFKGNTNLRTLEIKSKAIGTRSFQNCKNITSLTLHEGVEVIGDYAFTMVTSGTYMSGLELVIPSTCKEIKQDAFEYCKNFASVEIKRYVATDNDYPITKLSLNAGTTSTGELGLSKSASFPIYVPDAALSTYKADQYWSEYKTRVKSINNKP